MAIGDLRSGRAQYGDVQPDDAQPDGTGLNRGQPADAASQGRLFALDPGPRRSGDDPPAPAARPAGSTVARVVPDVSGMDKQFDYLVPPDLVGECRPGSIVRIDLNGRRVTGWVVELGVDPGPGYQLRPVRAVASVGPDAPLIGVARWAAWRWAGRWRSTLGSASPPNRVRGLPSRPAPSPRPDPAGGPGAVVVHRRPPGERLAPFVASLITGDTVVVCPRVSQAGELAGGLRRLGVTVRFHPREWAAAAGRGGVVIGARSAVWARVPDLAAIVVVDEHDQALQDERNPTWHARDVAIERARRAGISCHLVSPCPSVAGTAVATATTTPSRAEERAGWPLVEVIDRRAEEPGRSGLFSPRLAEVVRGPGRVLAVLNRTGRSVMMACARCGELVRTTDGEHLMVERDGRLESAATGETRPMVCAECGATALKRLRLGVKGAAEHLAALVGEPVDELSAGHDATDRGTTRVMVGTEAALVRLRAVDTVAFLDIDAELLAPRYRAAEQAMALLADAARLVGGRRPGGRIVVQTRVPDHRVLTAAVRADPGRFLAAETGLRRATGLPPFGALAELSGAGAGELAAWLEDRTTGDPVAVMGPTGAGRYLARAATPDALAAALAAAPRPAERVRVAVDPPRA
ncbi:MAG: hypothetical protein ACK5RL_14385 [Acidimicrobiales bacterium]